MLMSKAEEMFLTARAPYLVERTLLTSGILASAMKSLHTGRHEETPHLSVQYRAPRESTYADVSDDSFSRHQLPGKTLQPFQRKRSYFALGPDGIDCSNLCKFFSSLSKRDANSD